MSMDRCIKCNASIDTDVDCECYLEDGDGQMICLCAKCRDSDEILLEFQIEPDSFYDPR